MRSFILFAILIVTISVHGQEFAWGKGMNGHASWGTALAVDESGHAYSSFLYQGTVDFDPGDGEAVLIAEIEGNTAIQKLSVNGDLVWLRSFEQGGEDGIIGNSMYVNAMVTDFDGNLYAVGSFTKIVDFDPGPEEEIREAGTGSSDMFILKLDTDGNFVWVRTFGAECTDTANDIILDNDGNLCITGSFCQTVDFDPGMEIDELTAVGEGDEIFILKMDKEGDFIWAKSVESAFYDFGYSIAKDKENNLYIGGYYSESADFNTGIGTYTTEASGNLDAYILKLNESGDFIWVRTIEGGLYASITSIDLDSYGNVYAVGDFSGVDIDFDTGAGTHHMTATGESDIFLLKLTNSGDFVWAKQFIGESYDRGALIEVSDINTLYIYGVYNGDIDVDPGEDVFLLEHGEVLPNGKDFFLVTLNEDGEFMQGIGYVAEDGDSRSDLEKGIDGSVYLVGQVSMSIDIDHSDGIYLIEGEAFQPTAFVLKLQDGTLGLDDEIAVDAMNLYPNPIRDRFQIQLNEECDEVEVEITDNIGRTIEKRNFENTNLIQMELNAPVGVYFVNVTTLKGQVTLKVLKR